MDQVSDLSDWAPAKEPTRLFVVRRYIADAWYSFHVPARSWEDAEAMVAAWCTFQERREKRRGG